jgi:arylsulfatase A-like enzyme
MKLHKSGASLFLQLLFLCVFNLSMAEVQRPNILLVVLDDLNDFVGHMGGHPQAKTPNIDSLADQGVAFINAHSNAAVCIPSRGSFMTGICPTTSRFYGFENIRKNETLMHCKTMPQYARENGYQTFTTGKVFHTPRRNLWDDNGIAPEFGPFAFNGKKTTLHPDVPGDFSYFGVLDGTFISLAKVPDVPASEAGPGYTGWYNLANKTPFHYVDETDRDAMPDERSAQWAVEKIRRLETGDKTDPFFMTVGFMRPHTPLVVPQKYFDMYPLETLQLPVIREGDRTDTYLEDGTDSRGRRMYATLLDAYGGDPDKALRHYVQAYLASVTFADEMVGKVMEALDRSRFRDNTIVVLTSDHGYHMGEKDFLFKYSLWEESTRVPFIVRHPDYEHQAGSRVAHPIALVDLFPSIIDFCSWQGETQISEKGAPIDGFSVKPFLEQPDGGTWDGPNCALSIRSSWVTKAINKQHLSLRSRDFRYIRYHKPKGGKFEELYDHRKDPNEWKNLAEDPDYKTVIAAMRKELDRRLAPAVARQQGQRNP